MAKSILRCVLIIAILSIVSSLFAVAPSVTGMVNMGHNLDYIARYIITHSAEFEPYMVEIAKVFIGSGVSGALTGAAALSTWARFAAITGWGLVAGLAAYDVIKGIQLIDALIELNDIKKGIGAVRAIQRTDVIGITINSNGGFYGVLSAGLSREDSSSVTYTFSFRDLKKFNGVQIDPVDDGANWLVTVYATNGVKYVSTFINGNYFGSVTPQLKTFLQNTGMLGKYVEIANSYSFYNRPTGTWVIKSVDWDEVTSGDPTFGANEPLFPESQPVGILTTVNGTSLLGALSPEEWGNVRSLADIAPLLRWQYMPYGAYRNIPSYENAPIQDATVDTSGFVYPNSGVWTGVSPETIQEMQQQLQTLTQQVQSILADMQQVQTIPELQQQFSGLQQTQVQIAELVQTLSQTLTEVATQTQSNTETVEILQEQYETAVQLMTSVQTALDQLQTETEANTYTLQQLQTQIQILSDNVDLSPVVQAVNEVATKIDALTEKVQSLDEYLHEGFFEKLAEKLKEILERLFVPDAEEVAALLDIEVPEYQKSFGADISFSSETKTIPMILFGTSVDLAGYIREYAAGLKQFMNIFVSGLAAFFVIRAFRVHLNID